MHVDDNKLREFILDSGLVTKAQLEEASLKAVKQKTQVGDILVADHILSPDDLRRIQAYILGIPFVNLKGQKIDVKILSLIPEPVARNHNIIAFRKTDNDLEVAMLETDDLGTIDFVKKKTGLKILARLTDTESIKDALRQYQKSLNAEFGELIKTDTIAIKELHAVAESMGDDGEVDEKDLKKLAEDLPVIRIVDTLLKHAIIQDASDIHIEPMENQVLVRYRIDGILRDAMVLPRQATNSITARIKVLSNLKLDEKRLPQDGRFKVDMDEQKVALRVSILPTYYGEKTVMRLLRENVSGFTLEALGFHGVALETLHSVLKRTTGLILTTGPTGSGKTTSLYTMIDILNTSQVNISTIEDPVEYQMQRVNQTQVKPEIGFTFASGLRSLVRQDPDIIMVGEIRDNETANLAINAALTGHLVLSTLHTNSSAGAMPRLIEMGAEPFLLTSTLNVVIAQRLVRKLTKAKEKYTLSSDEIESLRKHADMDLVLKTVQEENIVKPGSLWKDVTFYHPKASSESEDGYHGRLGIYEVLSVTPTIKELISKGANSDKIEEQARKEGMLSMVEDGLFKAAQGITSIEEVLRVITE